MEVSDEPADLLSTSFPGGVSCRIGTQTASRPEITLRPEDSLELVEDKLHVGSDTLACRKEIFRKGLWKNFFLLECYRKSDINSLADRGTAFLTDLVRVEGNITYATFLTAGHALYSFDRVVLKHSSDLLKDGDSAATVEPFIDLRTPRNKKKGWYEACSGFTSRNKHTTGSHDFGAIFVKKETLNMKMDEYDMSLDDDLLTVRPSNLTNLGETCPMFVAGYPKAFDRFSECTYLATSEGSYRQRAFLPKENFIAKKASNDKVPIVVDVHTADTREGMSGSPIIMGEFPGASSAAKWNVVAIHMGGTKVDGREVIWLPNAPADLQCGQGVNLARPVNKDVFEKLKLTTPDNQFPALGTLSGGKDEPDAGPQETESVDTGGSGDVPDTPTQDDYAGIFPVTTAAHEATTQPQTTQPTIMQQASTQQTAPRQSTTQQSTTQQSTTQQSTIQHSTTQPSAGQRQPAQRTATTVASPKNFREDPITDEQLYKIAEVTRYEYMRLARYLPDKQKGGLAFKLNDWRLDEIKKKENNYECMLAVFAKWREMTPKHNCGALYDFLCDRGYGLVADTALKGNSK